MTTQKFYSENEDFKSYVDRYAKHYQHGAGIPVEVALEHKIVKDFMLYLLGNMKG